MALILTRVGSQCLEIGKDCSGYRTTLTWGVGVASRGKLRGLSLPIANSQKAAQSPCCEKPTPLPTPAKQSMPSPPRPTEQAVIVKTEQLPLRSNYSPSRTPSHAGFVSDAFPGASPIPIPSSRAAPTWDSPSFRTPVEAYNSFSAKPNRIQARPRSLSRMNSSNGYAFGGIPYDDPIFSAPSTASVSTFSERSEFPSPHELPRTPEQVSLSDPVIGSFGDQHYPEMMPMSLNSACASFDFATPFAVPSYSMAPPSFGVEHVPQLSCNGFVPPQPQALLGSNDFSDIFCMDDFKPSMHMVQAPSMPMMAQPQPQHQHSHLVHGGHGHKRSFDFDNPSYPIYNGLPFASSSVQPPAPMRHNSLPNGLGLRWPGQDISHLH